MTNFEYDASHFTNANLAQIDARKEIKSMAASSLEFKDVFYRDLPLFMHSGILARCLAIQECYLHVREIPGLFFDFGTWKGSTIIILENLRAIHDPFDTQRKIIGLDTFSGYKGFQSGESSDKTIQEHSYSLEVNYEKHLQKLINLHERANNRIDPLHQVAKGDAVIELPRILDREEQSPVALAFFDLNAFKPTQECLKAITPRLTKGSVIGFWQFSRPQIAGERRAYESCRDLLPAHKLQKSRHYPSLIYMQVL